MASRPELFRPIQIASGHNHGLFYDLRFSIAAPIAWTPGFLSSLLYRSGTLKRIDITDVTGAVPIQTGTADNLAIPLPLGINFQFQVQSDMILYVGNCWSKDKRGYGSEWGCE
jgi:hypothetical protein